jgi:hypothetical protein
LIVPPLVLGHLLATPYMIDTIPTTWVYFGLIAKLGSQMRWATLRMNVPCIFGELTRIEWKTYGDWEHNWELKYH